MSTIYPVSTKACWISLAIAGSSSTRRTLISVS
jgi:hypothetical protein